MVSVAEQFGNLRQTLGSVLGIYALLRWTRTLLAKLTGRPPPADATALTPSAFAAFASGGKAPLATGPDGRPIPRPSKKPFVVFLLAVFGLPYLMGKLIRALANSQQQQQQNAQQGPNGLLLGPDGHPLPPHMQPSGAQQQVAASKSLDPAKLDFCRVLYDFPPADAVANGAFDSNLDLSVKKGDLVAVLDKSDPDRGEQDSGAEGQWWRCRARDGRMGYLPAVYLETIQRRPAAQITATGASRASTMPASVTSAGQAGETTGRAQTMSNSGETASRSSTLKGSESGANAGANNAAGPEKFQKVWVNEQ